MLPLVVPGNWGQAGPGNLRRSVATFPLPDLSPPVWQYTVVGTEGKSGNVNGPNGHESGNNDEENDGVNVNKGNASGIGDAYVNGSENDGSWVQRTGCGPFIVDPHQGLSISEVHTDQFSQLS